MKVYLDSSCLKRPFDDQTQARIRLETEAILLILKGVEMDQLEWHGSEVLLYENRNNPNPERRRRAGAILNLCSAVVELSEAIEARGRELASAGIPGLDALHLACAEAGKVDVFLTCDDGFIRRGGQALRIRLQNPVDFLKEVDL